MSDKPTNTTLDNCPLCDAPGRPHGCPDGCNSELAAERRIVEWHREQAALMRDLDEDIAEFHNDCADAIERDEHRG